VGRVGARTRGRVHGDRGGISLWANALRALDHLDVWPDLRAVASASGRVALLGVALRNAAARVVLAKFAARSVQRMIEWSPPT
jgi:2-polyprenyl-6-methoxyphenol hydroxylase-like FAD-dependent oxidoreductase